MCLGPNELSLPLETLEALHANHPEVGFVCANAAAYLLLYNLMFIVPLFVVFGCVSWGTTSMQLGGILQRHLVAVEVGIGVLLFGLGTWLILSLV